MTAVTPSSTHGTTDQPGQAPQSGRPDWNQTGLDYHRPMPRPPVVGAPIDGHCHLFAARHAAVWIEAAHHYGFERFISQTPLEEALVVARNWPGRFHFVAIPQWKDFDDALADDWLRRIEAFYNIGSRLAKFHMSPGTMAMRHWSLADKRIRRLMDELVARGMAIMTHVGDPDLWYNGKYAKEREKYGTREEHYRLWEDALREYRGHPWLAAHMGGNPEDLDRLQYLLDEYPSLVMDCSATKWMVREISARRDTAREFFIRNQDRIIFGSDQVSADSRGYDFLASRWYAHRKLWETANNIPSPILDPDVPTEQQPIIHGLALPVEVLQKLYHDNAIRFLNGLGGGF